MSTAHPACPTDPRPRCASPASRADELTDAGVGVSSDVGGARAESQSDIANAKRLVSAMEPGFRECYADLLKRTNGRAVGLAHLTFHINCDGYISWIRETLDGDFDEGIARCMISVAKDARFDAPRRGWAEIRVSLNLGRAAPAPTP